MQKNPMHRYVLGGCIALGLSYHGIRKKSLDTSGAIAASVVGFASFACSYRMGLILILFYYVSSKLTHFREDVKAKLEEGHQQGGQRNFLQVFASSLLATIVACLYFCYCGEDSYISFSSKGTSTLPAYLWSAYVAHYACCTADTWASELGVLSTSKPRLITTLREVPSGTNGGISLLGTAASVAGGFFIGLIFWFIPIVFWYDYTLYLQYPMVIVSTICGLLGSMIDSLLGATVQATYYSNERKCIVKKKTDSKDSSIVLVSGYDFITNEFVNFLSTLITMFLACWIAPGKSLGYSPVYSVYSVIWGG